MELRRIVALLPDRERATAQAWLALRPEIEIVARYRCGAYGVPAYCDHPACGAEIDRCLSFVCGVINTEGEDRGCGLHFYAAHLRHSPRFGQLAAGAGREPTVLYAKRGPSTAQSSSITFGGYRAEISQ